MNLKMLKRTLKSMVKASNSDFINLIKLSNLTNDEQLLMDCKFNQKLKVFDTCDILNISDGTYYRMLLVCLTKISNNLKG